MVQVPGGLWVAWEGPGEPPLHPGGGGRRVPHHPPPPLHPGPRRTPAQRYSNYKAVQVPLHSPPPLHPGPGRYPAQR